MSEQGEARRVEQIGDRAGGTAAPERSVVQDPPPDPDYPRYRVEPGGRFKLADVDPDASEHYKKKGDVAEELAIQRRRISELQ